MNFKPMMNGNVTHPVNLVEAARQSLPKEIFDLFMKDTGGEFTADQLCKFVDAWRESFH